MVELRQKRKNLLSRSFSLFLILPDIKNPHTVRKELGTEFPVLWSDLVVPLPGKTWPACLDISKKACDV